MVKKATTYSFILSALLALPVPAQSFNKSSAIIAVSTLSTISGLYLLSTYNQQLTKKKKTATTLAGFTLTALGIAGLMKGDKQANRTAVTTLVTNACPHGDSVFCV